MSYHDGGASVRQRLRRSGAEPVVPVSVFAQVYMFAPGHPRLPASTEYVQVVKRGNGHLVVDTFDRSGRKLKRVGVEWTQTAPAVAPMKTPVWWTKTGYWGPVVTPESVVGPVPMSPSPFG